MLRFLMFVLALSIFVFQVVDRVYLRTLTAKKAANAVSVKEGSVYDLPLETQEIVNPNSVSVYAKKSLVKIFNYRPGQAIQHLEREDIKSLFIDEAHFNRFKSQFVNWSNHEFSVNNISIKETVVSSEQQIMAPPLGVGGARIWSYKATMPIIDRGVGGTVFDTMYIRLGLVYLGPEGGMGIYSVKISL